MDGARSARGRGHALWLGILLVAFLVRVGIQLLQSIAPTDALPPFEAWQSGTIPYWSLLVSQAAIIAFTLWAIAGFASGAMKPNALLGRIINWIGIVYFVGAVARFIAGLTVAQGVPFLSAHLPGFFHIVLASMVLIAGDYFRAGAPLFPKRLPKRRAGQ
ncbi:MAG: hypothetical protein Q8R02_02745 [Hyphomonadaceae bacterium]|nr:hypothetical protein [Hyphomonadaceae bacterium]